MNTLVHLEQNGNKKTTPTLLRDPTSSLALVLAADPKCASQERERIFSEITGKSFPYLSCYCSPDDKS